MPNVLSGVRQLEYGKQAILLAVGVSRVGVSECVRDLNSTSIGP